MKWKLTKCKLNGSISSKEESGQFKRNNDIVIASGNFTPMYCKWYGGKIQFTGSWIYYLKASDTLATQKIN